MLFLYSTAQDEPKKLKCIVCISIFIACDKQSPLIGFEVVARQCVTTFLQQELNVSNLFIWETSIKI